MEFIAGFLLIAGIGAAAWGVIYFFVAIVKAMFTPPPPGSTQVSPSNDGDNIDGMNNGDYYSGPHGYSAMTGYPETQYGSGFDPDAEWNHEEEY